jgi:hypothetical protein
LSGVLPKARPQTIYRRCNHATVHRLVIWRFTEKTARNGVGVKDAAKMVCPRGHSRVQTEVQFRNTLMNTIYAGAVRPCSAMILYRRAREQYTVDVIIQLFTA